MFRVRSLIGIVVLLTLTLISATPSTQAQSIASLHLAMGNPSGAVASTSYPSNYLMQKAQYALSYNRDAGTANWVSWHLGIQDLGSAPRSDNFITDSSLPSGWYRVTTSDYTNSGYDRGHMAPSADRTATTSDNQATFYTTNIVPQAPDNNQGPWAVLEEYCRDLVRSGKELYIISGGDGSLGTIAGGKVNIPGYTWKVILVINEGSSDLSRVTTATRLIAVSIPNRQGIRANDWRQYRASVDQVEVWTGYNFFSNVSSSIQSVIEARVDTQ